MFEILCTRLQSFLKLISDGFFLTCHRMLLSSGDKLCLVMGYFCIIKEYFRFVTSGALSFTVPGRWSPSDHSYLGQTKSLVIYGKSPIFLSSGCTSNCQIQVLSKWSDQSCTPSAILAVVNNKSEADKVS